MDHLLERILSRENILRAWKRVKANGGAPGMDGMTISAFPVFARQHWDRIRQMTSRRRGISMPSRIKELRRYAVGWLNYFGVSHTYTQVLELDQWIRRRVRMCFWKQWQRPRTRRRHLLALGVRPEEVHLATCCRRGYWWMSGNGIVQRAMHSFWLEQPGVPNLRQ